MKFTFLLGALASTIFSLCAMEMGPNLVPLDFRSKIVTCTDTNKRVRTISPLSLAPGKIYVLEADVTIDKRIKGPIVGPYQKGACAYIEYANQKGKWLGGAYLEEQVFTGGKPKHLSTTTSIIKDKSVRFVLGVGLSKGCIGTARFDNISVRELILPPPKTMPYRYANVVTNQPPRVWIDSKGRTIVDGNPFFPLGIYGGNASNHVGRFKGGPFNTLVVYGAPGHATLNRAAANGLRVIAGVNHYFAGCGNTAKGIKDKADEEVALGAYMQSVKDHPALLAWYAFDELPITMLPQLMVRYAFLKRMDSNHPVWAAMNNWAFTAHYLGTFDVAGCDPYPIPDKPISLVAEATRIQRRNAPGRAVWMISQIFNWANYSRAYGRVPTQAEIRNMTWQTIVEGSNGIIFFKYGDLLNNAKSSTTFEKRWADIVTVAREVRQFFPFLLSGEEVGPVLGQTDKVRARAFCLNGKPYLVIVNASYDTCPCKLTLPWCNDLPSYSASLEPLAVKFIH